MPLPRVPKFLLQAHHTSCAAYEAIKQAFERAVLEELFGGLQNDATELVRGLISGVGNLCASAAESLSGGTADEDVVALDKAANAALGAAIRSMGPAAVLEVLPLNLMVSALSPPSPPNKNSVIRLFCRNIHSGKSVGFCFPILALFWHLITCSLQV